jgi:hypothetical protein
MSATQKLEIDSSVARIVVEKIQIELDEKMLTRDGLSHEIEKLQLALKSLRDQLNGKANGKPDEASRATTGDNRARIKDYLLKTNGRLVQGSEISKATGIGSSSVAYTLNAYPDFVQDKETKRWKLTLLSSVSTP